MSNTDKQYNGWTNYETWNVALWMGNDAGSQSYWDERAQELYDAARADKFFTKEARAVLDLAGAMKNEHEDAMCDMLDAAEQSASMWADLLSAALSEVNWHAIAEHLLLQPLPGRDVQRLAGADHAFH